jgi:hypothetical protein
VVGTSTTHGSYIRFVNIFKKKVNKYLVCLHISEKSKQIFLTRAQYIEMPLGKMVMTS